MTSYFFGSALSRRKVKLATLVLAKLALVGGHLQMEPPGESNFTTPCESKVQKNTSNPMQAFDRKEFPICFEVTWICDLSTVCLLRCSSNPCTAHWQGPMLKPSQATSVLPASGRSLHTFEARQQMKSVAAHSVGQSTTVLVVLGKAMS